MSRLSSSGQGEEENNNKTTENSSAKRVDRKTRGRKNRAQRQGLLNFGDGPVQTTTGVDEDFGDSLGEKRDGMMRLVGMNIDMLNLSNFNNEKGMEVRDFCKRNDVDGLWGQELGVNLDLMPRSGNLDAIFRSTNPTRTVGAHNVHDKSDGRRLYGGTFAAVFGELATRVSETGVDETGLGRWCWTRFQGKDDHSLRIISAYHPNKSKRRDLNTVYSQHLRYHEAKGETACPLVLMRRDLGTSLRKWRDAGEKLIVFLDANEDVTNGSMQRLLTGDELNMREVAISQHPDLAPPASFQRGDRVGTTPLDGVFATNDVPAFKAGWLAAFRSPGDHRVPYLEVDTKALLGESLVRIVRPQARRLTCRQPKVLRKYRKKALLHMANHKVTTKLLTVYGSSTNALSTRQEAKMESLDLVRKEGMEYAENKCRNLSMGEVDCSPEVGKARQMKLLWKKIVTQKRGGRMSSSHIRRKARRCGVVCPLSCTLEQALRSRKAAIQAYEDIKPKAPRLRVDYLHKKANDYSTTGNETSRKHASRMLREERQREASRHLRRALGKTRNGGIDWIEMLDKGKTVRYSAKEKVEEKIMKVNETKFRKAASTPPMTAPLVGDLGFLGNTDAAKRILNGTYQCPPGVDAHTQNFIAELQVSQPILDSDRVSSKVSREDYKRYWKRCKESTSSSISGLHFGHWKAAAECNELSEMHALFTEIAVTTGYSPTRWQKGLSVMLEKILGCRDPEKLRAILLMEADFNFANKLFLGKRMMEWAEKHNEIPIECYGSRKGHQAIDVAVNRAITWDLLRQKRHAGSIASVDAQTCYDRIAHSIASLSSQRLAVSVETMICLLSTLQLMKFFLRTAFGDSDTHYGGSLEDPLQGVCQGNGGGPGLWLAVSLVLVKMLHSNGHIAIFVRAITGIQVCFSGFIFVDDTDLVTVAKHSREPIAQVIFRSQAAADTWHGGLRATGGALRPDKCSWCLVDFYWSNGQWKYLPKGALSGVLKVPGPDGEVLEIKRLEPWEPIKAVGVIQAADGSMTGQVNALQEKIDDLGTKLRDGWVPRRLAWQGFNSMIWSSLRYTLPATNMSKTEADRLTIELYKLILPTLGASKNFPKAYRHGPTDYQGLGAPDFWVEQGISKVSKLLVHGDTASLTAMLMDGSLQQAQLEVGTGTPLLQASFTKYGFLCTNCWIKGLWEFLSENDILLSCPDYVMPPLQREGDAYIMDNLIDSGTLTTPQMIQFNRCRIRKEALTLADVIDGGGLHIQRNSWAFAYTAFKSEYEWAREHPASTDWNDWRRGLRNITSQNASLPFHARLGSWIAKPHRRWEWFYSPSANKLYRGRDEIFHVYTRVTNASSPKFEELEVTWDPLPADACRATARKDTFGRILLEGWATSFETETPQPTTVRDVIDSWGEANWPLEKSDFENAKSIAEAIESRKALAVCDGSYMPDACRSSGAAAWIVEHSDTQICCNGVVQTSGEEDEVNPYRSELQGLHALLMALLAICKLFNITQGYVKVGCDNETAVWLAGNPILQLAMHTKHVDLVRAIRKIVAELPIEIEFVHVDGHQDKHTPYHRLDRMGQLNVQMDSEAKRYLRWLLSSPYPTPCPSTIFKEGWSCHIQGTKTTTDPAGPIRRQAFRNDMIAHVKSRHKIEPELFDSVDWDANRDALNNAPVLFSLWATKHVSGFCGVGRKMHQRGEWENAKCHSCEEESETTFHLYVCPHEDRVDAWTEAVDGFEAWMEEVQTHPDIIYCVTHTLRARSPDHLFMAYSSDATREAAIEQDAIGWNNFVEGRVSTKWRELQGDYYLQVGAKRTTRKWAEGLVCNLLALVHKQWIARNAVVHQRDPQGLKIKDAEELEEAIDEQFQLGAADLLPHHHHHLTRGRDAVDIMTATQKKTWLSSILLYREVSEAEIETDTTRARDAMFGWLQRPD